MTRTMPSPLTHRRAHPSRPQPPRQPRYVAVAVAGVFAIVPAGMAQEIRPEERGVANLVESARR